VLKKRKGGRDQATEKKKKKTIKNKRSLLPSRRGACSGDPQRDKRRAQSFSNEGAQKTRRKKSTAHTKIIAAITETFPKDWRSREEYPKERQKLNASCKQESLRQRG